MRRMSFALTWDAMLEERKSVERLDAITDEDVAREGFPGMSAAAFVEMFCEHQRGVRPDTLVQRIEFHRVRAEGAS